MSEPKPLMFVVAAALVDESGHILLARRPQNKSMAGLWEFPGGKVAGSETPEQALARELQEELGILVATEDMSPGGFSSYAYDDFHLFMPLFICRRWKGEPQAFEHSSLVWARPSELIDYEMPAADRPLISQLERLL